MTILDTTFILWHGAWPRGYLEAASGIIKKGTLVITQQNPYHRIPKRVLTELQSKFNPRIIS